MICFLCLGKKIETVDHLLDCPALAEEVKQLKLSVQRILKEAKFPLSYLELSWKSNLVQRWVFAANHMVSEKLTN